MNDGLQSWWAEIMAAAGSLISAAIGVAMRHAHNVQQGGVVPPWGRILLDAPTLFVAALAGHGAGEWLHSAYAMPTVFGEVVAVCLAYLGPSVIDRVATWLASKKP